MNWLYLGIYYIYNHLTYLLVKYYLHQFVHTADHSGLLCNNIYRYVYIHVLYRKYFAIFI